MASRQHAPQPAPVRLRHASPSAAVQAGWNVRPTHHPAEPLRPRATRPSGKVDARTVPAAAARKFPPTAGPPDLQLVPPAETHNRRPRMGSTAPASRSPRPIPAAPPSPEDPTVPDASPNQYPYRLLPELHRGSRHPSIESAAAPSPTEPLSSAKQRFQHRHAHRNTVGHLAQHP